MTSSHGGSHIYTLADLIANTTRVMTEIQEAGKSAFITSYGRFIAIIQPLEPGQLEQQALAAMARESRAQAEGAGHDRPEVPG